jgi:hypothetical protein
MPRYFQALNQLRGFSHMRSASAKVCAGEKRSPIVNARGIARLGMLAVGLRIAAVASTPGIASVDTPADPVSFSSSNLGDLFPAADAAPSSAPALDLASRSTGIRCSI